MVMALTGRRRQRTRTRRCRHRRRRQTRLNRDDLTKCSRNRCTRFCREPTAQTRSSACSRRTQTAPRTRPIVAVASS